MSTTNSETVKSDDHLSGKTKLKKIDFIYDWSIDDFNAVLDMKYEIHSPIFASDEEKELSWKLILFTKHIYPTGPYCGIHLARLSSDSKPTISKYCLSLVDDQGTYHQMNWQEKLFTDSSNIDEYILISHAELIEKYYTAGTLYLRFEIELFIYEELTDMKENITTCNSLENNSNSYSDGVIEKNLKDIEKCNDLTNSNISTPKFYMKCSTEGSSLNDDQRNNIAAKNMKSNISHLDENVGNSLENLSDSLRALYITKQYSDITIVAENVKFRAHKAIICSRSEYFKNICAEYKDNTLSFEDIKSNVMENVLFYLYSGKTREISTEIGLELLHSAKKFRLFHFQQLLVDVLEGNITDENVTDVLRHSEDLKLKELKDACLQYTALNYSKVSQTEKWKRMMKNNPKLARHILDFVSDGTITNSAQTKEDYFS